MKGHGAWRSSHLWAGAHVARSDVARRAGTGGGGQRGDYANAQLTPASSSLSSANPVSFAGKKKRMRERERILIPPP